MEKYKDRLTTQQERALAVLQAHPGEWMTSKEVYREINGCEAMDCREYASMGCALRSLPEKIASVGKMQTTGVRASNYAWLGEKPAHQPVTCKLTTTKPAQGKSITAPMPFEDAELVSEALLAYSTALVATEPMKALRAAYLAGKGLLKDSVKAPGPKASKPAPTPTLKPEPAPVKMPEGMTYDELCDEIERSGLKFGRPWYDFSARVGMTPDYFERIATRRGNPSRHTMEQVYAAFFTPFA